MLPMTVTRQNGGITPAASATAEGRDFGYQLTFFRRALQAEDERRPRISQWAAEQVYLAHFALTDVQDKNFYYFDRLGRGAAGLAGAIAEPDFKVWLEDWSVEQSGAEQYRFKAAEGEIKLELILEDSKGPILQGQDGYSQKGPGEGNASMYYSLSRLDSSGTITIGELQHQVKREQLDGSRVQYQRLEREPGRLGLVCPSAG